jgi:GcrA cell cycle regulator
MQASGGGEKGNKMEPTDWAPGHSDALRDLLAQHLSFSKIAAAINKKFNTGYSRSATLGRARRMGLLGSDRPGLSPLVLPRLNRLGEICSIAPTSPRL